jgi:prepilin-type N-terminal cleavage/methylation domain-containing protein
MVLQWWREWQLGAAMSEMDTNMRFPGASQGSAEGRSQTGMTLIELLIAMSVLSIGMLGSMVMILLAMQTNSRNRTDTTAAVLDQEVIEKFSTLKQYPQPGFVTIYDCALTGANAHESSLGAGPSPTGAGAALYQSFPPAPSAEKVDDVDWSQATPPLATSTAQGYTMEYQSCTGDIYEVRWNVMAISPNPSSRISLLTVSSRQRSSVWADGTTTQNRAVLYAQPTTLHELIESH